MMSSESDTPDTLNSSSSSSGNTATNAEDAPESSTTSTATSASVEAASSSQSASSNLPALPLGGATSTGTNGSGVRGPSSHAGTNAIIPTVDIPEIPIGDLKVRPKLRFEVVTARVIETAGKKHVSYTVMMKRSGGIEPHPAVIERRYNDFCYVYECILRSFHPSILGDFMFPKKVLIGNFKAEVITERTEAFHKFLNQIANCDNLLYSDYFYSFLSSEEHNEAVSHIKLSRYEEAAPLLENIFYVREKLLTISNLHVLQCLCELVATMDAVNKKPLAFAYIKVAVKSFELVKGHPEAETMRISFLKLASQIAGSLGQDKKEFDKQLSEMRYQGVRLDSAKPLLEMIRERYIHRASHTAKLA